MLKSSGAFYCIFILYLLGYYHIADIRNFYFILLSWGTNESEVSKELVEFLHYLEHTTDEEAAKSDSERLKRIHHRVCKVKLSEEVGIKYMQAWEEKYYEREEGREEGRLELLQELIKKKVAKGMSVEAIAEVIEEPVESVMQIIAKMEENK